MSTLFQCIDMGGEKSIFLTERLICRGSMTPVLVSIRDLSAGARWKNGNVAIGAVVGGPRGKVSEVIWQHIFRKICTSIDGYKGQVCEC